LFMSEKERGGEYGRGKVATKNPPCHEIHSLFKIVEQNEGKPLKEDGWARWKTGRERR